MIVHEACGREILGQKGHRKNIIIIMVFSVVITHIKEKRGNCGASNVAKRKLKPLQIS